MSDSAVLLRELEQYAVVSLDVFDTLLTRVVWHPQDVFRLVARKIDNPAFVKQRIVAEQRARTAASKKHAHEDITIDEIYAEPDLPDAKAVELAVERIVCVANPNIAPVLAHARKLGKTEQARDVLRFPLPGRMVLAQVGWDWSEGTR